MTPRRHRMLLVGGIVTGVALAGALALRAFQENVMFFFDPTQVAAGEAPEGQRFRLGGMVRPGTVQRAPGSLEMAFVVTDFKHDVAVRYTGVVPDLFRENQGVVAHGRLQRDGSFVADEILAKHDENYMAPEVARALKEKHGGVMPVAPDHRDAAPATPPARAGAAPEHAPESAGSTAPLPQGAAKVTAPRLPGLDG